MAARSMSLADFAAPRIASPCRSFSAALGYFERIQTTMSSSRRYRSARALPAMTKIASAANTIRPPRWQERKRGVDMFITIDPSLAIGEACAGTYVEVALDDGHGATCRA